MYLLVFIYLFVFFQLSLPPWPMYRLAPLQWQKARNFDENEDGDSKSIPSKSAPKEKKKKK